jgi:hypothetical protein
MYLPEDGFLLHKYLVPTNVLVVATHPSAAHLVSLDMLSESP